MNKLTKEDILKGKDRRETLHVDSYDADVIIRPLTDGELGEVFAIIGSIPLKNDGTPDTGNVDVTKNFKALRLTTALGLVEPKLTVEEVAVPPVPTVATFEPEFIIHLRPIHVVV